MTKRRFDRVLIPQPLIEASGCYRSVLCTVKRDPNPSCDSYLKATKIMDAIDELMGEVTGDRALLHLKSHASPPNQSLPVAAAITDSGS